MGGKQGRRRQDHLARRAQSEGYHARSVYKLQAIQRKFRVLPARGDTTGRAPGRGSDAAGRALGPGVLDLGAAPGSWTQFVVEHMGRDASPGGSGSAPAVLAVDLQELDLPGAICLQGDFTEPETAMRIRAHAPFRVVLSDAAPATTGNRVVDTGRSEVLVESILAHLPEWLAPGGNLVCKLFQGGGEQALLGSLRARFSAAHLHRPEAVRRESFETYLVGLGYHGPGEPARNGAASSGGNQ
ncbi:MAG: RlmE family RNA methyltransferase [Spirochaetaceae bacterium]|nr:MAG: RlmE family RNA methyltransferase [Spirochaetaceae bacterium]